MSIPTVNYRESFFEKPDLTPVIGKPDYETLYQTIVDLRTNAISVHSNLGGGNHGHLGLLMSPAQYAVESQVPFIRPTHPGALNIPVATARHLADQMEREYKENLRVFHEVRGVEKALTQQVVSALESKYLLSFKNRQTGQFNGNLLQILQHLQTTYGQISPAQLSAFEKEVIDLHYDPTTPIDIVFQKIEDLMMYGDFAQCPFTAEQAIQRAYNIVNATGLYKDYIKTWSRRPRADKTWPNFKDHFRTAHLELQETGELTLHEAGYGNANLVEDIVARLTNELNHRANIVHEEPPVVPAPEPAAPVANATVDSNNPLLAQILQQNAELLRCIACNSNDSTSNAGNQRPPARTRLPRRPEGPRQGQPRTPLAANYNKYCWTHGHCNHPGSECRNKAPGHKDQATMQN